MLAYDERPADQIRDDVGRLPAPQAKGAKCGVRRTRGSVELEAVRARAARAPAAMLANTYISSVTDIGPGGIVFANSTTLKPIPVSRYVTWDVRLGYTEEKASGSVPLIKGWRAAVGVNNLPTVCRRLRRRHSPTTTPMCRRTRRSGACSIASLAVKF